MFEPLTLLVMGIVMVLAVVVGAYKRVPNTDPYYV